MIVVNLFGAPDVDKDVGAAYIYSRLKMLGVNAEMVNYDRPTGRGQNQTGLFGRGHESLVMADFYDVEVAVTDSPLLNCSLYNESPLLGTQFNELVRTCFDSYENMNYFVTKSKSGAKRRTFAPKDEMEVLSKTLRQKLTSMRVPYANLRNTKDDYDRVVSDVLNRLKNPPKQKREADFE